MSPPTSPRRSCGCPLRRRTRRRARRHLVAVDPTTEHAAFTATADPLAASAEPAVICSEPAVVTSIEPAVVIFSEPAASICSEPAAAFNCFDIRARCGLHLL